MQNLKDLFTIKDVDDFIDYQICRYLPLLRAKVESRCDWSTAERAADSKLDAVCRALERRAELECEIRSGFRAPDGNLNIRV